MNSTSSVKRNRKTHPGNLGLHHVTASPQSQAGCGGIQLTQPELSLLCLLEGEMCKAIFKLSEGYHPREQIKKQVKVLEAGFSLWEEGECKYRMGKGKGYLMWTDRTRSGSVTAKAGMSAGTRMCLCRAIYVHTQVHVCI